MLPGALSLIETDFTSDNAAKLFEIEGFVWPNNARIGSPPAPSSEASVEQVSQCSSNLVKCRLELGDCAHLSFNVLISIAGKHGLRCIQFSFELLSC